MSNSLVNTEVNSYNTGECYYSYVFNAYQSQSMIIIEPKKKGTVKVSFSVNVKFIINSAFLKGIGLDFLAQKWLTDPHIAFGSVMAVDVWRGTGYIMTMLIAGIVAISPTYYEAANIDGANAWQQFRYVTLPMLRQTLAVTIVLNVIYGLKVFDIIYALTNGGPGHRTEVMNTAVFSMMSKGLYAEGTTISSVMFVFMVIIGYFMVKILTKDEVVEG